MTENTADSILQQCIEFAQEKKGGILSALNYRD